MQGSSIDKITVVTAACVIHSKRDKKQKQSLADVLQIICS